MTNPFKEVRFTCTVGLHRWTKWSDPAIEADPRYETKVVIWHRQNRSCPDCGKQAISPAVRA